MKFASVRTLKSRASELIRLVAGGKDVIVTVHGKPAAILKHMTEDEIEDYVLSRHHGLRKSIEDAYRDGLKRGGLPLAEFRKRHKKRGEKRRGRLRR